MRRQRGCALQGASAAAAASYLARGDERVPTLPKWAWVGSAALYRSPLGVLGTGLRGCGDWYGHKEDICGRSFNELNVIHTR